MNEEQRDEHNRAAVAWLIDRHGPEIWDRVRSMMLERAESFPDRDRNVKWVVDISASGEIILDVQP